MRSSWVGPSPPEITSRSAASALPDRLLQLGRLVPDERDPRRLEPEPRQLLGQERPVRVPAAAADQLAAGDEDSCARASSGRGDERDAARSHFEIPARPGARSGHDARPAVELEPQVRRRVDVDPEAPALEALPAARSRAFRSRSACSHGEPRRTTMYAPPATPRGDEPRRRLRLLRLRARAG